MKHKKLRYIPGLISILGLPVLLLFWGPPDPVYYNVIKHNLPPDANDTLGIKKFTRATVYKTIKNKKIITIDLDDSFWNERLVNRKYYFIQSEMERLQFTADTNSVLNIHFGSFNTYSNFIWVLNRAMIYDFKRYAFVDDDFYFFPSPHHIVSYEAIVSPDSYQLPVRKEPTQWESFKTEVKYTWWGLQRWAEYMFQYQQQNKLLAGGFLLLIFIPAIIRVRKYIRNNNLIIREVNLHTH